MVKRRGKASTKVKSTTCKQYCLACTGKHAGPINASCTRATQEQKKAFAAYTASIASKDKSLANSVLQELKNLRAEADKDRVTVQAQIAALGSVAQPAETPLPDFDDDEIQTAINISCRTATRTTRSTANSSSQPSTSATNTCSTSSSRPVLTPLNVDSVSSLRADKTSKMQAENFLTQAGLIGDEGEQILHKLNRRTSFESISHPVDWPHLHVARSGVKSAAYDSLTISEFVSGILRAL